MKYPKFLIFTFSFFSLLFSFNKTIFAAEQSPANVKHSHALQTKFMEHLKKSEIWTCEGKIALPIEGDVHRDQNITLDWHKTPHKLEKQYGSTTGAVLFYDKASTLKLIVIPSKAMLFSNKTGERIADNCQTAWMREHQTKQASSERLIH